MLIYFLRGNLPWQGMVQQNKKDKYKKIFEVKQSTPIQVLCNGLPHELAGFLDYCRNIKFDKEPDYNRFKNVFKELYKSNSFEEDGMYDWNAIIPNPSMENPNMTKADCRNVFKYINHYAKKRAVLSPEGEKHEQNQFQSLSLKVNAPDYTHDVIVSSRKHACCSKSIFVIRCMHHYIICDIIVIPSC